MAQRIQRRRTKGWQMPSGTVYVGRPTRWGNPYALDVYGAKLSLALYNDTLRGLWGTHTSDLVRMGICEDTYARHTRFLKKFRYHPLEAARTELRGKDLSCWCPLDQACHADILLDIANS